jgi:hypothetical protein
LSKKRKKGETYESSDAASKGIVSSLTTLVNAAVPALSPLMFRRPLAPSGASSEDEEGTRGSERASAEAAAKWRCPPPPPSTPEELLERIRDDYLVRNYLWTGDLDASCFDEDCLFNDPTLSFRGIETYRRNVRGLRPVVEALTTGGAHCSNNNNTRSDLINIRIDRRRGYIETRWKMVGDLIRLPWKPRVDVVGRTKFWYRTGWQHPRASPRANDTASCLVVHYDEEWEIPAYRALLQLVTPSSRGLR